MKKDLEIQEPTLSEKLNEHPYIQWIAERRSSLIYFFVGVIVVIYLLTRITTTSAGQAEADYIQAESNFLSLQREVFEGSPWEEASQNLTQLKSKLRKYPDLHTKYDAPLAQTLILAGQEKEAQPFAEKALKRTKNESRKFFHQFSEITLLIENQKFEDALNQSLALQEEMGSDQNTLFAYNLLRIAALYQQLGNKEDEIKTWDAWEMNLKNKVPGFMQLANHFDRENVSIVNYIEARKKNI